MTELAVPLQSPLLPAVWKLLRLRFQITWNGFKHAKLRRKIFTVLGYVFLLAFGGGIFYASWLLLGFLRSPSFQKVAGVDAGAFLLAVPALIFSLLFFSILLTSFGVLLQALYLSGDMDFLLTTPVPIRAVFVAKMLQAVLPNFSLLALFGLPVLFGLGLAERYNFLYFPLVILVMVALTLAAAGLAALLVMLVVRVMPPRRAAEILGFLGATLGLVCGQASNIYNSFGRQVDVSGAQVTNAFSALARFNSLWMPFAWPGRGLIDLGTGRWLTAIPLLLVSLGATGAIFALALTTAERWYYTGWSSMQVVTNRKKRARPSRPAPVVGPASIRTRTEVLGSFLRRLLPAPVWAVIWKDFLVYRRDLRNLSQLISPLILGVIYSLLIFRTGGRAPQNGIPADFLGQSARVLLAFSSVGMSIFVGWMLLNRLSGMAFSAEGKNYWLLKASPLKVRDLMLGKFLVAYVPTFLLSLVFLVVIGVAQKMSPIAFLYSLLAVAACLAGMNGMLLGFGAAGAKLDWDDPRKMNAGTLGCIGQIATMAYVPLVFGLFIGPVALALVLGWNAWLGYLIGGAAGILVNLAAMILPPWLAKNKVERLGEA